MCPGLLRKTPRDHLQPVLETVLLLLPLGSAALHLFAHSGAPGVQAQQHPQANSSVFLTTGYSKTPHPLHPLLCDLRWRL